MNILRPSTCFKVILSIRRHQKHGCKSVLEIQSICDEQLGVKSELKGTPFVQPPLRILFKSSYSNKSRFFWWNHLPPFNMIQHEHLLLHHCQHAKWGTSSNWPICSMIHRGETTTQALVSVGFLPEMLWVFPIDLLSMIYPWVSWSGLASPSL